MNNKILIILTTFPSKHHPYLIPLYLNLIRKFPNLSFYLFRYGDWNEPSLISNSMNSEVLQERCIYRFQYSFNPIRYVIPVLNILKNFQYAIQAFKRSKTNGRSFRQSIGQLLYNNRLLGEKYDLVYFNALQSTRHFSIEGFFFNTPILASSRGKDFDLAPRLYSDLANKLSYLHVLSMHLKSAAIREGFSNEKILIIPPAVPKLYNQSVEEKSKDSLFRLVTAARLSWEKGLIYLIRGIELLKNDLNFHEFELIIFGEGPDYEFLMCEIHRLDLNTNIKLMGWQEQEVIDKTYISSDIYILTSISEAFNNSVLQAQNYGLPCIVTDVGGLPENVIHMETGIVVEPYSPKAIAEAISLLVQDKNLRLKLGKQAKERVQKYFLLDDQVEAYSEMFKKALGD